MTLPVRQKKLFLSTERHHNHLMTMFVFIDSPAYQKQSAPASTTSFRSNSKTSGPNEMHSALQSRRLRNDVAGMLQHKRCRLITVSVEDVSSCGVATSDNRDCLSHP